MTWHSNREMSWHAMEGYASYILVETTFETSLVLYCPPHPYSYTLINPFAAGGYLDKTKLFEKC